MHRGPYISFWYGYLPCVWFVHLIKPLCLFDLADSSSLPLIYSSLRFVLHTSLLQSTGTFLFVPLLLLSFPLNCFSRINLPHVFSHLYSHQGCSFFFKGGVLALKQGRREASDESYQLGAGPAPPVCQFVRVFVLLRTTTLRVFLKGAMIVIDLGTVSGNWLKWIKRLGQHYKTNSGIAANRAIKQQNYCPTDNQAAVVGIFPGMDWEWRIKRKSTEPTVRYVKRAIVEGSKDLVY